MPLSEDDQRIFREIEQTFYEHDPEFARRVAESPSVVSHSARNMKLAAVGLVAGLVLLFVLLPVSPVASFGGFALMVASGYVFVDNARKAGKVGLASLNDVVTQRRETLGGARDRMKGRLRRDDD
jgi:hypothetical protein